jgi:flagellar biosynthesis/type III secretory pathway protein FliH
MVDAAESVSAEDLQLAVRKQELAQVQAEIASLKKEAQDIVNDAQAQAAQIRQDAARRGYEEGFAQAQESVRGEREAERADLEASVLTLKNARDSVFEQIEGSVKDLAMYVAEHILKIEMDRDDETFLHVVRDTLSKVKYQNDTIIRVSKNEYEKLFADPRSEIVGELKNSGVEVRQDLSLKEGDCIAETAFGAINAGIKTQLKRLGYALEDSSAE